MTWPTILDAPSDYDFYPPDPLGRDDGEEPEDEPEPEPIERAWDAESEAVPF